ncbi:MAG TPA: hypothetical protein VI306_08275 [Pyrinomonadaceae bacterium]
MKRQVWLAGLALLFGFGLANAQTSTSPSGASQGVSGVSAEKKKDSDESPLTTFEEEMRAKRAIKLAEKEHEENIKRAREISQIALDLKASLANASVAKPDPKKVDRLEKLTKKVRGEAGGEDDDVQIVDVPPDIPAAVNQIADAADQLSKDVQKTPRQVVSAAVIDRANVLLELVKILRGFIR